MNAPNKEVLTIKGCPAHFPNRYFFSSRYQLPNVFPLCGIHWCTSFFLGPTDDFLGKTSLRLVRAAARAEK